MVAGKNDATIVLHSEPRLENIAACQTQAEASASVPASARICAVSPEGAGLPITVTLGSHCNTKVKVCAGSQCLALVRHSAVTDPVPSLAL